MTAGRYELQHDDAVQFWRTQFGLGVAVLDQHTGRPRSPHSLSGGETFLASLALALGLADVVTSQSGGITLDTLFVDEGFGSLDADTLEIAMSTLDSLHRRTHDRPHHSRRGDEGADSGKARDPGDAGWVERDCAVAKRTARRRASVSKR